MPRRASQDHPLEIVEGDFLAVCEPGEETIPRAKRPAILSRPAPRDVGAAARPTPPKTIPPPSRRPSERPRALTSSPFARRSESQAFAEVHATPARPTVFTTSAPAGREVIDGPVTARTDDTARTRRLRGKSRFPWGWAVAFMGAGAAIAAAAFLLATRVDPPRRVAVEPVQTPVLPDPAVIVPMQKRPQIVTFGENDALTVSEPTAPSSATATAAPPAPVATDVAARSSKRARATAPPTPADALNALSADESPKATTPRIPQAALADAQLKAAAR